MEYLDIGPLTEVSGRVRIPGSKSISNRVLLLAALADGITEVRDLLASDDTARMLEALQTLGVRVEALGGEAWRIHGCGGDFPVREADLFHCTACGKAMGAAPLIERDDHVFARSRLYIGPQEAGLSLTANCVLGANPAGRECIPLARRDSRRRKLPQIALARRPETLSDRPCAYVFQRERHVASSCLVIPRQRLHLLVVAHGSHLLQPR